MDDVPTMQGRDSGDLCRRHGFDLVETLAGRVGGSVAVLHVRDNRGAHFVLKVTDALHGAGEIAALKAVSASGAAPRFKEELEPGVYVVEWLPGRSLAEIPPEQPVDGRAIGRILRLFHQARPPSGLRGTDEWLRPDRAARWDWLPREMRALGERLADQLRAYRPPTPVLLHGDLVPANVLMTSRGPRLIDPAGLHGLPAWDLAQLAVSAEGRGRRGLLHALMDGYDADVPQIAEMVGWMVLFYLDKNRAMPDSPFTRHLQPLAEMLIAAPVTTTFLDRFMVG